MKFFGNPKISLALLGFVVGLLVGGGSAKADFIFGSSAVIGTQARGTLVAWGLNDDGQCNVPRGSDFIAVSGGHWHSLALRVNGSLVSWGSISEAPSGNDFVAIASGSGHNLALKADGSLVAWGGTAYGKSDVPQGNDFVAIAARGEHNLALKADGSIVAWGLNNWGQCDVPEGNDFVAISAGHSHSVAIKADGSLVSWGQLTEVPPGNDFVAVSAGPMHNLALRADGSLASGGGNSEWHENDVPAGNDFVDIATGSWHCLAIKTDGSVVAWGRNLYGECDVPRILSARSKEKAVAIAGAEGFHSIAIIAAQPERLGYYFNDFEGVVGDEWSSRRTDVTPVGARRFLGQFGDENIMLTLSDLPAHTQVTVSFDLFIIRSWDGNNQIHGPDIWQLKVDEGPTLVHTTFANAPPELEDFRQAYPGNYPGRNFLPYTGAVEIKTLGYTEIPSPAPDAVYHFVWTFAHTASILRLDFSGQGLQIIQDESWGLDNVKVDVSLTIDFNGDRKVDIEDLVTLVEYWGQDEPLVDIAPPPFGDGIVDTKDLELFLSYWGEVSPETVVYMQ
jgi:alpha-tubulin suppressor-like RCC1 family protein